jgi:hypothetical protein
MFYIGGGVKWTYAYHDIGIQIVPLHGNHFRHRWHWYPDRHVMERSGYQCQLCLKWFPCNGAIWIQRQQQYKHTRKKIKRTRPLTTWSPHNSEPLQTQLTLVSRSLHYMETTSDTVDIGIQIVPLHGNHFRYSWHWYPDRSITWKPLQTQMTLVSSVSEVVSM